MDNESPFNPFHGHEEEKPRAPKPAPFRARPPRIVNISTALIAVPSQGLSGLQLNIVNRTVCTDDLGRAWELHADENGAMWRALPAIPSETPLAPPQ